MKNRRTGRLGRGLTCLLAGLLLLSCTACTGGDKVPPGCEKVVIPESYYEYFGDTPADDVKSLRSLGSDYCTKAYRKNGGVIMMMTPEQKKNLLFRNASWIESYQKSFLRENDAYKIRIAEDYTYMEFDYDAELDDTTQQEVVQALSYFCVLDQLIGKGGPDWSLEIRIRNCHTGAEVADVTIPGQPLNFSKADWEKLESGS